MYFTVPFRPVDEAPPPEHDVGRCPFAPALSLWLRTAIVDYISLPDSTNRNAKVDDWGLMRNLGRAGCCQGCLDKALRAHGVHLTPAVWPAILWVAFQLQTRDSSKARSLPDFLSIINANQEEHLGLWAWDDEDERMLRSSLGGTSPSNGSFSPWTDGFPAWRQYLDALDDDGWTALESATRRTSRIRLQPAEYDAAVRIGGLLLWVSSSSKDTASSLLASLIPCPLELGRTLASQSHIAAVEKHQFLRHFLVQRSSSGAETDTDLYYALNLNAEPQNWNFPGLWLTRNKDALRSNALQDPKLVLYMHVVENVYMISHLQRALPLVQLPPLQKVPLTSWTVFYVFGVFWLIEDV
ncbi:hypothetical protein C8F01DRAFT_320771 [Mycena amicta]|nr:hypothetical protein C8F01DRAFT_320771 [Mycena amicta]